MSAHHCGRTSTLSRHLLAGALPHIAPKARKQRSESGWSQLSETSSGCPSWAGVKQSPVGLPWCPRSLLILPSKGCRLLGPSLAPLVEGTPPHSNIGSWTKDFPCFCLGSIYSKGRVREKPLRFTPQMAMTVGAGLDCSWEPGALCLTSHVGSRDSCT